MVYPIDIPTVPVALSMKYSSFDIGPARRDY
jgi:hypothetical protein